MSTVINFVGGPGTGKSLMTAQTFIEMKLNGIPVDIVPEFAKKIVWTNQLELLNDQYYVSEGQYNLLNEVKGNIPYIITDGSLLHGLVYNQIYEKNLIQMKKNEQAILNWFYEFKNIVIFLERNPIHGYESMGRTQDKEQAEELDKRFIEELEKWNIPYTKMKSDLNNAKKIIDLIPR